VKTLKYGIMGTLAFIIPGVCFFMSGLSRAQLRYGAVAGIEVALVSSLVIGFLFAACTLAVMAAWDTGPPTLNDRTRLPRDYGRRHRTGSDYQGPM
jgi:hypothetical protein